MKFWKVCPIDEVDDPDRWCLAHAPTARDAAIEHLKYLTERDDYRHTAMEFAVTPEGGGVMRQFTVRAAQVWTFSAEERVTADA